MSSPCSFPTSSTMAMHSLRPTRSSSRWRSPMPRRATLSADTSIGIALFPEHAAKPETLMQCAESALAEAKTMKMPYAVYTNRAMDRMAEAWDIESEMDAGLQNGEFEVYYQPKIDLR